MKLFVACLFASLAITLNAQDTLYFDPTNDSDPARDGTLEHPYLAIDDISFSNNTTYLIKRNTTMSLKNVSFHNAQNIRIGAWGEGTIPTLECGSVVINGCDGFFMENIEIYSDGSYCLRFHNEHTNKNIEVQNCILRGRDWDVNGYQIGLNGNVINMLVENTEIYDIYRDGVYLGHSENVTFKGCYIHDINLVFFDNPDGSDGDAMQILGGSDGINIQKCIIDRSNTGKKFGVILTESTNNALMEDNIFIGPKRTEYGGANLFLTGENHIIRRNIFRDAPSGIYSHAPNPLIHHNQFIRHNEGIYIASNAGLLYNNTFYDDDTGIYSWLRESIIKNNVVYLTSQSQEAYHVAGVTMANNLQNIKGEKVRDDVIIEDPLFADVTTLDFRLLAASPCIDAGTDVGLTYDYSNNPIPCNSIPDIGAFEDQTGCSSGGNQPPIANAGSDTQAPSGQKVHLDGSASSDADGDSLYFRWTTNNAIKLKNPQSISPWFVAPQVTDVTTYKISLEVSDGVLKSSPDIVVATINPNGNGINTLRSKNNEFKIFPNPIKKTLQIQNQTAKNYSQTSLHIYSLRGTKVLTMPCPEQWQSRELATWQLPKLPTGIYIAVIQTGEQKLWQDEFLICNE